MNNSELAWCSELAHSSVSMVLSQQRPPGFEFCVGVSKAFGMLPERVLSKAGLIPQIVETEHKDVQRLIELARVLPKMNVNRF